MMSQRVLKPVAYCLLRCVNRQGMKNCVLSYQYNICETRVTAMLKIAPQLSTNICALYDNYLYKRTYSTESREPPRPWTDLSLYQVVSATKAKDIQLFDVRTVEEVEETGMMPGATNIPLSEMKEAITLVPEDFKVRYGVEKPNESDWNIVLYCLGGVRSGAAMQILHEEGYFLARHYTKGWEEYGELTDTKNVDSLRPWTDLTFEELMSMIKSRNIQLFDIRTHEEVESTGMMPGATNIPGHQFEDALNLSPSEFKATYGVDKPSKDDDNVVIHCLAGFRSLASLSVAWEAGFTKFRHYPGGWHTYANLSQS